MTGDLRTERHDLAGELVARHDRVRGGELAVHDVQVVPQIPTAAGRTTTSSGPGAGAGTVSTEIVPGVTTTAAFT
ncbi:hypothetical protein Ani05nite_80240 [Amorphoplanes nipponensis]|uniref:Uncharacterized protein n=1 Tax=Actinoplanes nipponensis TaxID=135950 RepID=A0A919JS80_9ACTN|nr:hypothetical protein Ani05nite_80240 [Actinoplanes nipponensis]